MATSHAFDGQDFSNFKKVVTCGGRSYDEFSNFHPCQIVADDQVWPTAEHYFQALKFPGDAGAKVRSALREAPSPMRCWQIGTNHDYRSLLRADWEEAKVDAMYEANLLKFKQSDGMRRLLVESQGPIRNDGGLFWASWNSIILERVREELRSDQEADRDHLALCKALMGAYRETAARGDARALEAVTVSAAERRLPPVWDGREVRMAGALEGRQLALRPDPVRPEVNGCAHWASEDGSWHLYLGRKHGRCAWVLDECLAADEATGMAFFQVAATDVELPVGTRPWQVWDESASRHASKKVTVTES